jgi:hypothetical protein
MKTWLRPKAFIICAALTLLARFEAMQKNQFSTDSIFEAVIAAMVGGVFWGVVVTYFLNKRDR